MVQKTRGTLFIVFLLFGMILTMQFRTILLAQQQSARGQTTVQSLSDELENVQNEGLLLHEQLRELEEEEDEILNGLGNDDNPILSDLLKQKKQMEVIGGFMDVKGPGVIVSLNDAPARSEMDPSDMIIHDADIAAILNILRSAGAQALAINDERILATSKQLCAGPTILINRNRYPVPYVIKAIGDPDLLYSALEESEAVLILQVYDIQVAFRKELEIVVPEFRVYEKIDNMISGLEVVVQ